MFILDAIFCGTSFLFFQGQCVACKEILTVFVVVQFINSTGLAIVAEADLHCGDFLTEKSCRHKLVVYSSCLYRLLKVSSVLTSLKYTATIFWVVNSLWAC